MTGGLILLAGTQTLAETAPISIDPTGAFVETYIYACQPVEYDFAGMKQDLGLAAQSVHDSLFVGDYKSSCRDFYFEQVVPRLKPENRPYFIPIGR
jgi:hypothetical protein